MEIEHTICQISEEIVMLEAYPRADLNIVVHVLESDGYSAAYLLLRRKPW
jgi:ribonuclease PH